MLYYWLIFGLFLLFVFGSNKKSVNKGDLLRLIIPLVCLFIFFAFRVGFTPDYYNYEDDFHSNYGASYNNGSNLHSSEVIYYAIIRMLPYRTALIIQTALFCICMFTTFRYYVPRKYWWFAVVLFFTYTNFLLGNISAYRSSYVSIALLFAIIVKAHRKHGWVLAALVIYLSSMIHHSALFLLPFALLSDRPVDKKNHFILVIIACFMIIISLFWANTINTIANSFFEQVTDDFDSYKKDSIENISKIGTFTILRWLMLGYLLFSTLKYSKTNCGEVENICTKLAVVFFMIDFLPGIMLIDRITYNLAFPSVIGMSSIVSKMTDQKERTLYVGMAVLYGLWEIYLISTSANLVAVHSFYQNILFK